MRDTLLADPQGLVAVSGQWEEAFKVAAQRDGPRARELWSTTGIDYSKGRMMSLKLFACLTAEGRSLTCYESSAERVVLPRV